MKLTISVVVLLQQCALLLANPVPEQHHLHSCTDSDFVVTVDNHLDLYIDGAHVSGLSHANTWKSAGKVNVAASAQVIAIKGVNDGLTAGILASGADSKTDGSWKCTNKFHEGWADEGFDDSAWPAAKVIGPHGILPWFKIQGISSDAKWIWTARHLFGLLWDKTAYCRKRRACHHEPATTTTEATTTTTTEADPTGTGPSCITSCNGRSNGDYQSCIGCDVYATCSNGYLYDERPCAPGGLVWDDNEKRCEWESATCTQP